MYSVFFLLFFFFVSSAESRETLESEIKYVCGIDDTYLYGAANVWYGFSDLERAHSISESEAMIIESSLDDYCLSEEYQELGIGHNIDPEKLNLLMRKKGFQDKCSFMSIVEHSQDKPLEFSTKFETRIYATKADGLVTVWFKYRGKGALKFNDKVEQCIE